MRPALAQLHPLLDAVRKLSTGLTQPLLLNRPFELAQTFGLLRWRRRRARMTDDQVIEAVPLAFGEAENFLRQ